ncbi:lysosomal Pro-X carboxypeptidase-like isoform X2 [Babylonia areolata]|uniref:lysosomal Pro-X carboxypeptidase-like isoform X2 n=2 Tax=Babylonia areolata TaxID=304850 RepID=UPI003FD46EAD
MLCPASTATKPCTLHKMWTISVLRMNGRSSNATWWLTSSGMTMAVPSSSSLGEKGTSPGSATTLSGFLWESAPEFKALLVFAEHRYYGESLPYGPESFANSSMLNYLTAEQAMGDFASLIQSVRQTIPGAVHSQVITVGGSYGGVLAAWMRLKYPNLVLGALASSAPLWQFTGLGDCGTFYATVDTAFLSASQYCVDNLADIWYTLDTYWPGNLDFLTEAFGLCKPVENKYDLSDMLDWVSVVLGNLAMVDYPYPASFLQPLPAWPVQEFCKPLSVPLQGDNLTLAVAKGIKMYFNYTGQADCIDMSQTATHFRGAEGWHYQTCTEMVMPVCSNNSKIIFNIDWDFQRQKLAADCKYKWGVTPRDDWVPLHFWGKDILSASNIIFSNGMLDPWSGGGVLESLSPSLIAINIPRAAQHLDLRAQHPADPPEVQAARQREKNIMKNWLYGIGH